MCVWHLNWGRWEETPIEVIQTSASSGFSPDVSSVCPLPGFSSYLCWREKLNPFLGICPFSRGGGSWCESLRINLTHVWPTSLYNPKSNSRQRKPGPSQLPCMRSAKQARRTFSLVWREAQIHSAQGLMIADSLGPWTLEPETQCFWWGCGAAGPASESAGDTEPRLHKGIHAEGSSQGHLALWHLAMNQQLPLVTPK